MNKLIQKFWIKIFWAAVRQLPWKTKKIVGARTVVELSTTKTQVTLIVWDLTNPKWNALYSREELINMLAIIRHCEREMKWKVPEEQTVYTIEEIRKAFWKSFHEQGELFFDYLDNDVENNICTESYFNDLQYQLENPNEQVSKNTGTEKGATQPTDKNAEKKEE